MTPTKTTASIRIVPKWLWRVAIGYMVIGVITYMVALPIRYNQIAQASDTSLATLQIAVEYTLVVVLGLLGFMLVTRRPNEAIAVLIGMSLPISIPNFTALSHLATHVHPIFHLSSGFMLITTTSLTIFCLISLPDGYPRPRWLLFLIPVMLIYDTFRYLIFFVFSTPEIQASRPIAFTVNALVTIIPVIAMIYRYRFHATTSQKQQFKWLLWGLMVEIGVISIIQALRLVAVRFDITAPQTSFISSVALTIAGIIFCLSLILAITRYGLWDVDLTINRSVVATGVTIILAIIFIGIFLLIQSALPRILGDNQREVAFAVAALVIGSIFNPVRYRVRHFVDRRLYGFRFDLNQLERHQDKTDISNPGALTGKVLGGYTLLDVIGRGGMGEVYKGVADGEYVAVKVMHLSHSLNLTSRNRFWREGKITLNHPNIVRTYYSGEEDNIFYMVIDYIEGQTLKEFMAERGSVSLQEISAYLGDLAQAIDYAHSKGYIHRDIKPSNIMLQRTGTNRPPKVILMDFGVAKNVGDTVSLTGSAAVGTIDYMAPEQIQNSTTVDFRADIYALGVVLYEALSGMLPFKGTLAQVLFAHVNQPAPDIRQLRPNLPPEVSIAIHRALQKDPNDRFQSATEFVTALTSGL